MKKPPRTTELCEGLCKDINDLRSGKLDPKLASVICRHVNAVVKAENVELQYDRIIERESR